MSQDAGPGSLPCRGGQGGGGRVEVPTRWPIQMFALNPWQHFEVEDCEFVPVLHPRKWTYSRMVMNEHEWLFPRTLQTWKQNVKFETEYFLSNETCLWIDKKSLRQKGRKAMLLAVISQWKGQVVVVLILREARCQMATIIGYFLLSGDNWETY